MIAARENLCRLHEKGEASGAYSRRDSKRKRTEKVAGRTNDEVNVEVAVVVPHVVSFYVVGSAHSIA